MVRAGRVRPRLRLGSRHPREAFGRNLSKGEGRPKLGRVTPSRAFLRTCHAPGQVSTLFVASQLGTPPQSLLSQLGTPPHPRDRSAPAQPASAPGTADLVPSWDDLARPSPLMSRSHSDLLATRRLHIPQARAKLGFRRRDRPNLGNTAPTRVSHGKSQSPVPSWDTHRPSFTRSPALISRGRNAALRPRVARGP